MNNAMNIQSDIDGETDDAGFGYGPWGLTYGPVSLLSCDSLNILTLYSLSHKYEP